MRHRRGKAGFTPVLIVAMALCGATALSVSSAVSFAQANNEAQSNNEAQAKTTGARASGPAGHALFPTEPKVTRLSNGLTVVTLPWNSPDIVAYYTLVRVGSRDEVEAGHSGFAHLFEHMMFRGTERFPEAVYERTIQDFGADNNAYTTQDFTLYTVTSPASALPQLVELEADRFQNLKYDEGQFRTETGAVRGEYDKSASNPGLIMWEALSEMAFGRHTYGHTTLGYKRDIDAMPEKFEYSKRFFKRFYTPDNTTILAVGDVAHDNLVSLVEKAYGKWRGRRHRARIAREPEPRAGTSRHIEWAGAAPPMINVGYRTPAFGTSLKETAALEVLHGMSFSESSPLYQRLVVSEQKLLSLGSYAGNHTRDPHLFIVSGVLKPGGDFAPVQEAIQAELAQVAAGEVSAARIEAVKNHLRYGMVAELETPNDVADLMARFTQMTGEVTTLDAYLSALQQVTAEDVSAVAKKFLTEDRRFVVTLAPKAARQADKKDKTEAAKEAQ